MLIWTHQDGQSPAPGPAQHHPPRVTAGSVTDSTAQALLELCQAGAVATSLEHVPVPKHPLDKIPFPYIQS